MDILQEYKSLKIDRTQLLDYFVQNAESLQTVRPQPILAVDVSYAINSYIKKNITTEQLVEWANVVGGTDLFTYNQLQSDCVTSVVNSISRVEDHPVTNMHLKLMLSSLHKNSVYYG